MAICNPAANPPPLKGARVMTDGEVTPEMQRWAASYAYDGSIPIGRVFTRWFTGRAGQRVPVVARVECHSFTVNADGSRTPGAFHGVTLYVATDLGLMSNAGPDWTAVAVSAVAIVGVCGLFALALRHAGRLAR